MGRPGSRRRGASARADQPGRRACAAPGRRCRRSPIPAPGGRAGPLGSACRGPVPRGRTAPATSREVRTSTWSSMPRSASGQFRSSPTSLRCRAVDDRFGRATSPVPSSPKAQASEPCSEKVGDLGQAFLGSHEVGRQGVGAGKGAIEIVGAGTGECAHLPLPAPRYPASPAARALRSIQPRTVPGSLSRSRAISSSERPSPCSRTASAWRLR